jgi:hypothetical protein
MTGDQHHLLANRSAGEDRRAASQHETAARVGAGPVGRDLRIAVEHAHVLDRHADFVRHDLRQGRLEALAMRRDAEHRGDLARGVEADRRRLGPGRDGHARRHRDREADAGELDIRRDTDPEPAPVGARACSSRAAL